MTQNNAQVKQQTSLPQEVRQALSEFQAFTVQEELFKNYGFPIKKLIEFDDIVLELLGENLLEELPDSLSALFEIDTQKAKAFSIEFVQQLLLPLDDLLDVNVRNIVLHWGGVVEDLPAQEVLDETTFVKAYIAALPGTINERQAHRVELVFLDLLRGEMEVEEAKQRLMRSEKVGGLGLEDAIADKVMSNFLESSEGKLFQEAEEEEIADDELPPPVDEPALEASAPKPTSGAGADHFSEEDEREIQAIHEEKKHAIDHKPVASVEDVISRVCQNKEFSFENPLLTERCQKIIESRVRGARDPFAARRQIELAVDQGGLGVSGRQLSEMTQILEQAVQEYEQHSVAHHEKGKALEAEVKEIKTHNEQARGRLEQGILDKRYTAMTGQLPQRSVTPVGPKNVRTSVGVAAHVETQRREGKIDVEKVKQVIEASKPPVAKKKKVPAPRKVQDVTFDKRLAGPTEELLRLTLTDFRRLSSDPVQATTKIKDKIDLLEEQGYEMKVEGIKAWRSSPMNKLYMKLTETAVLDGVPIAQVLEDQRKRGEDTLTDEELKAVMNLNATLRF